MELTRKGQGRRTGTVAAERCRHKARRFRNGSYAITPAQAKVREVDLSENGGKMKAADAKGTRLRKPKKKRETGSKQLRSAAGILLRHDGRSVIEDLAENCRDGQVQSAKLLYEMVRGAEEAGNGFRSLALELDGD